MKSSRAFFKYLFSETFMFDRIKKFFEESRAEFRHVNWPSRQEAMRLTAVVVILSLALAAFLGGFDYLFSKGVEKLINLK